jgi:hypothetical protein
VQLRGQTDGRRLTHLDPPHRREPLDLGEGQRTVAPDRDGLGAVEVGGDGAGHPGGEVVDVAELPGGRAAFDGQQPRRLEVPGERRVDASADQGGRPDHGEADVRMVLPSMLDERLDGQQVSHQPVVGRRPDGSVVGQGHLVVGVGTEDFGRGHDHHMTDAGGGGGQGERSAGPQQRGPPLDRPVCDGVGEVGAHRYPHEHVHAGQLGGERRTGGVDHPPVHAVHHPADRREHADLRHAAIAIPAGGEELGDPERRHPDRRARPDDRHYGHTRRRRFALGGTVGGTQRVLLVVV